MSDPKKDGKKASSRLLGMKFMQRSMEKEMQEQLEKERKRVISEAEWVLDTKEIKAEKPKIQIEYQPSFLPFAVDTTAGRRSFNSFNKSVEAKVDDDAKSQRLAREEKIENANKLSDKEFGEQMQTIRSVSKKSKKRKSDKDADVSTKKSKVIGFMKPE
ncbi:uncharacterized protein EV154DRAFT_523139 [Mucor mucedo]|uniref:uncharacterized protein n=1 Tax=Mucor mucedo TaxID=29922 RepID=UPI002221034F|nr:uncharacterized protein EV154DRAFT_523139 [Mucor mucedo]KAI7882120.1 hypothetical protein EV154DRAFT_523139 [Mucor mucedo]